MGDSINLPLDRPVNIDAQPAGNEVIVLSPSGARVAPRLLKQRGQTLLHLDEVAEAGIYQVSGRRKNSHSRSMRAGRIVR